ncbi:hypothetical protein ASG89_21120 [Paenibacillus sp. Soil766]|uniref:Gfo/Idh/MocA family oxidoreductase n=1 Tax=Paenibacillus sp. Soil766 TaxID=1736404 RepID=UPI0007107362|nr:Gfo/Idh/MocA family oxidoreductase [Paenibacillus sp. Soil766]KRF04806.1 hypothetical protein ASG89_21120 [Paenibacillus sp. Soil766]
MKKPLQVGLIGCGAIMQRRHLPEYLSHAGAEVIAICDLNIERAQAVAREYGIPFAYATFIILSTVSYQVTGMILPVKMVMPRFRSFYLERRLRSLGRLSIFHWRATDEISNCTAKPENEKYRM